MKVFIIAARAEAEPVLREARAAGLEAVALPPGGDLVSSLLGARPDVVLLAPTFVDADAAVAVATVKAAMDAPRPLVLMGDPAEVDALRPLGAAVLARPVTETSFRVVARTFAGLEATSPDAVASSSGRAGWPLLARMADLIDATFDEELWATARKAPSDQPPETSASDDGETLRGEEDADEGLRARVETAYALVEEGDYFRFLGVSREASGDEIADAHARLRSVFDDDGLGANVAAQFKTQLAAIRQVLEEAWRVLGDEDRRRRYLAALGPGPPPRHEEEDRP